MAKRHSCAELRLVKQRRHRLGKLGGDAANLGALGSGEADDRIGRATAKSAATAMLATAMLATAMLATAMLALLADRLQIGLRSLELEWLADGKLSGADSGDGDARAEEGAQGPRPPTRRAEAPSLRRDTR